MATTSAAGSASPGVPTQGISLCLSGGGYRAAIYHLGALRWLNQCGVLPRLNRVSCVSGGSIVGAHLAYRFRKAWPTQPLSDDDWETQVVEPFWNVVNHDVRTWPVLVRLLFCWNWFRSWSTVEALREQYVKHVFEGTDVPLSRVKGLPEFVFCATDMVFGVNWEATWQHVGNYEAGHATPVPDNWTMARAVAASSCFPPVFPPAKSYLDAADLKRGKYGRKRHEKKDRAKRVNAIRLTDGGVYDNLGLQPVMLDKKVLVSDGGGSMSFAMLNVPWRRLARYPALLQNGIGKLRKSWLMRDYRLKVKEGTYWGIGDGSSLGGVFPSYQQATRIGSIRTDLNRFTRAEFEVLQNHGYLAAAEKTSAKCPHLLQGAPPLNTLVPPYKDTWINKYAFYRALRFSSIRFWPYFLR
ncbi:MAG: patatin-like phospholipase family protein [Planctomycetota bacterium]|jgi:NTE family protein